MCRLLNGDLRARGRAFPPDCVLELARQRRGEARARLVSRRRGGA
jgi:hypothetical protein